MAGMIDPTLDTGLQFLPGQAASPVLCPAVMKPAPGVDNLGALQPAVILKQLKAQKGKPGPAGPHLGAGFVHGQPQGGQIFDDLPTPIGQLAFIVAKKQHVIDVAQVGRAVQAALDEMVQRIQVDIRPELAGEIADGQAAGPQERQQVIPRKADRGVLVRQYPLPPLDDAAAQFQDRLIPNHPGDVRQQNLMINGWKKLTHIQRQDPGKAAQKNLGLIQGAVRSLANPVGITLINKRPFKKGPRDGIQRMVDDPVAKRGGRYPPPFGVVDVKTVIIPRPISA